MSRRLTGPALVAYLRQFPSSDDRGWAADEIERLRDDLRTYKSLAELHGHQVITCGVAARHPDANLSRTGAYAGKWNSQQAEDVRALRSECDTLRAALQAAVDCGMVPKSSAAEGGANRYSEQVRVADQIRAALSGESND